MFLHSQMLLQCLADDIIVLMFPALSPAVAEPGAMQCTSDEGYPEAGTSGPILYSTIFESWNKQLSV